MLVDKFLQVAFCSLGTITTHFFTSLITPSKKKQSKSNDRRAQFVQQTPVFTRLNTGHIVYSAL